MQAEADARRGRVADETAWSALLGRGTYPVRAVRVALVLWFAWQYWRR
jgi:hypothetical protein